MLDACQFKQSIMLLSQLLLAPLLFGVLKSENGNSTLHWNLIEAILRNYTSNQLNSIPNLRQAILENEWAFARLVLTKNDRRTFWRSLRDNRPIQALTKEDILLAKNYISIAPDHHLIKLNLTDPEMIRILGKMSNFNRAQATCLVKRMIQVFQTEKVLLSDAKYINLMGGLLCGFSGSSLKKIPRKVLPHIDASVFNNLYACTKNQLKILRQKLFRSSVFGIPQVWSAKDVRKIGLVILALQETEMQNIRPVAMGGLHERTLRMIRPEVIKKLTRNQYNNLSPEAKAEYHKIVGVFQGNINEYRNRNAVDETIIAKSVVILTNLLLILKSR